RRQESEMSTTSGNPPTRLRVVVVDDHSLVRSGVRSELEAHAPDLAIVGEAADVESAVAVVHQTVPDVVLLDVHLPGGRGGGGIGGVSVAPPRAAPRPARPASPPRAPAPAAGRRAAPSRPPAPPLAPPRPPG